jgi:hypothetical protein
MGYLYNFSFLDEADIDEEMNRLVFFSRLPVGITEL